MNALFTAIFARNPRQVRAVVEQHPELLSERFTTGELPIQFAASHPLYISILVYLIRHGAPGSERFTDWQGLLESYVRYLSDSFACAGWLDDIEFILWCVTRGEPFPRNEQNPYGFAELSEEAIEDLQFLCKKSQHWPYWDQAEERVRMAPLIRWKYMYQDWYAGQRAKQNDS